MFIKASLVAGFYLCGIFSDPDPDPEPAKGNDAPSLTASSLRKFN